MVTVASCGPRMWSAFVIGGNREGDSGPGVGADVKFMQAGEVAATSGVTSGVVSVTAACVELQAVITAASRKMIINTLYLDILFLYRLL
jgi:hypothetical protein